MILKMQEVIIWRASYFMGNFKGYFEGSKKSKVESRKKSGAHNLKSIDNRGV